MPHVAARMASRDEDAGRYQRHRPEQTLLYQIVDEYYPAFAALMAEQGRELPVYVHREFEEFLKCGRLEHGFLRVRCESCHAEHLVAFSCKRRGFCPSCGARRMAESAALLVDEVLPKQPMRQWVLSFPFQLRFLFASRPEIMGRVLGIVYRVIATHLVRKAGHTHPAAKTGAVTLIQRFGSALNLNVPFCPMNVDTLKEKLADIDADTLRSFIFDLYLRYPELSDKIEALTLVNDPIALSRVLCKRIASLKRGRRFIDYRASFDFVRELEAALADIESGLLER